MEVVHSLHAVISSENIETVDVFAIARAGSDTRRLAFRLDELPSTAVEVKMPAVVQPFASCAGFVSEERSEATRSAATLRATHRRNHRTE